MSKDFSEKSYEKNEQNYKKFARNGDQEILANSWLDSTTIGVWRFNRMWGSIDSMLLDISASWLTVGDGGYGLDAHYIYSKGVRNVLATDISDYLLKEGKEKGLIPEFKKENAEKLSFMDEEFDYVLCKEAYHHFPRPMIALYEMLRVCKKAVVLIEPNDPVILNANNHLFFFTIKNIVFKLLNKKINSPGFEEAGNYLYTISPREIEKVALGMNFSMVAYKGINDSYIEGVEFEKANNNSLLFKKIKRNIHRLDILSKAGLMNWGLLICIIFKEKPTDSIRDHLQSEGYRLIDLPENPYIH